ncbi:20492_t:CDS:2 [Rhizophagus irregularis]|nr:20492_t:CDS:2 [Rhizophagus irregularis]
MDEHCMVEVKTNKTKGSPGEYTTIPSGPKTSDVATDRKQIAHVKDNPEDAIVIITGSTIEAAKSKLRRNQESRIENGIKYLRKRGRPSFNKLSSDPIEWNDIVDRYNNDYPADRGYDPSGEMELLVDSKEDFMICPKYSELTNEISEYEWDNILKDINEKSASGNSGHFMSGGLKGDSTSSPIHLINNLIEDEKKQLWIMFQDIAKAFDSISIKGLELALQRIAVPPPI